MASKGYKLLKVFEVWHFDEMSQYDPSTKTGGLFTEYVTHFYRSNKKQVVGLCGVIQNQTS
jgi:hypothetical protein